MKILVTGGAGFIGSHTVVELLNAGFSPVIIDDLSNSKKSVLQGLKNITGIDLPFYEGDCNDRDLLKKVISAEGIEGVIHFAAYKAVGESVDQPLKYYRNNVGSLVTLLEVLSELKIKNLVFSSSCTVYGQPDIVPVSESTPRKPAESPYGNTKTIGEDILRDTIKSGAALSIISLRYFNPIGAHPSAEIGELPTGVPNNLVPYITQTAIGIRKKLTVFGNDYNTKDGSNVRDFIHVVDLAKAHVSALNLLKKSEAPFYDVFNVGTGTGNSVLEIIETFEKVNDLKLNYEIGPRRSGDVEQIYGNVDKARDIMGWQVEKTLDDSLRDAWAWEKKINNK
ncbi:UDP-glucose 4-epimerase GalE [Emticicia sp. CRIBPO]|uniref:UDP-glucose 4-epimerase GalE n=1 Tax=Emticicia sp. CRIBPO TaxID=2683258 RepID=UPI001412482B|nr:UDP-glucose 4-epimerase GalE [Emticicia sp. CRIBPO]NBA84745.1 UDP-glucose 4-epimerase GalE [Emticicia sp. CRIBPO]